MIQQLLKQIALLSLLQTVFSKKSVDIIQHYFGNTKGAVQNQVGNTYRIRKQSLAFVQSRARYFNAKSDQICSVVSSASISTKRKFSLSFGHLGQETVKEMEKRNAAEATGIKIVKIQDKENISPNEMSNRASWAKRTLFQDFDSVQGIAPTDFHHVSKQGAIHAKLASIVYEDSVPNVHSLGHSIVARGTTADVKWMVTDSVGHDHDFQATSSGQSSDPTIIRTITIRGFDASDEEVDRGRLVTDLCNAGKVTISDDFPNLKVHRGLLSIAKRIYEDVKTFIDLAGPAQKIVLTGHSIGGALANLVLMLMTVERGNVFVREKVKRVFTFGSPPIAKVDIDTENSEEDSDMYGCSVLNTLGLPSDIVYGYVGPWDPIVRLFSPIDTLEPLIGDLGDDGVTIYASGPPRTLRLVIRALLETWEDWPTFRDNNRYVMKQDYTSIGVQHILMSDRGRFLSDRLLAVDINAFPVDDVLRVSSKELYGVLEEVFPLNVFSISVVPTAIRSFVHHFVPAYADGFDMYIKKKQNNSKKSAPVAVEPPKQTSSSHNILNQQFEVFNELSSRTIGFDFADHATTWVLGGV